MSEKHRAEERKKEEKSMLRMASFVCNSVHRWHLQTAWTKMHPLHMRTIGILGRTISLYQISYSSIVSHQDNDICICTCCKMLKWQYPVKYILNYCHTRPRGETSRVGLSGIII